MKVSEIRQLSDEELRSELDRLRRHLFDLRSQAVTEKLEDPSLVTKTRRDIARLLTTMQERAPAPSDSRPGASGEAAPGTGEAEA